MLGDSCLSETSVSVSENVQVTSVSAGSAFDGALTAHVRLQCSFQYAAQIISHTY